MVNGTTYCSINAMVHYGISQQTNNNKVHGALIDGGTNGGLLCDDACVLEHVPKGFVNFTGVASFELANLKLSSVSQCNG